MCNFWFMERTDGNRWLGRCWAWSKGTGTIVLWLCLSSLKPIVEFNPLGDSRRWAWTGHSGRWISLCTHGWINPRNHWDESFLKARFDHGKWLCPLQAAGFHMGRLLQTGVWQSVDLGCSFGALSLVPTVNFHQGTLFYFLDLLCKFSAESGTH